MIFNIELKQFYKVYLYNYAIIQSKKSYVDSYML